MSQTPEWANYKAQNVDGAWWWFEAAPEMIVNGWLEQEGTKAAPCNADRPNAHWRETLIKLRK